MARASALLGCTRGLRALPLPGRRPRRTIAAMPRFCANISLMFNEVPLPQRFDAAARAGFDAVEIQFPYAFDAAMLAERASAAGVEVILINMPPGNWDQGDRGIGCLASRVSEFRDGVKAALAYAHALECRKI